MKSRIHAIIEKLKTKPKKIFLIDGLGALITAFFLGIILANFETSFGMPKTNLYLLSIIACIFAFYSFCCSFFVTNNWRHFLKWLIIANAIYSCLSIGLVFHFFQNLTILGLFYFLIELTVMISLILFERLLFVTKEN